MIKIYCIPKLRTKLRTVNIDNGLTDAEELEDGYLSAAYMWQRAVCGVQSSLVSNNEATMEKNSIHMMMAIEQQKVWVEPFKEERMGIFKLRKPMMVRK